LIFEGVQESNRETWEFSEAKLLGILKENMNLENISFERVHRLGNTGSNRRKPRPIIAKFSSFKERQLVWNNRTKLKGSNVWVSEDYPQVVHNNRKTLIPILKAAKQSSEIQSASLKQDKLFINGKQFTVENLDDLPEVIQPHNVATVKTDNALVFFSKNAIFSNFHPSKITINGSDYCCNEQYYQAEKARYFGDGNTLQKILQTTDPFIQLSLGKEVQGYKHDTWMERASDVLEEANRAKYHQNGQAREALLATGTRILGEASRDKTFGIGLALNDENVCDTSAWKGKNIMGKILTNIRDSLI